MAQRRMLTETDRAEISRGTVAGLEGQVIAARIGRCPSAVSREIARHGGRGGDRAVAAQRVAAEQRSRPKTRAGGSPDQVAGRLRYEHPGWVSHEAIYTWIYALPKGALDRLGILLRTGGRTHRRPRPRGRTGRPGARIVA